MDEVALMLSSSGACYAILNTILMLGTMESFYASVQFLKFSTKLYCTDFVLNPRHLFWDAESTLFHWLSPFRRKELGCCFSVQDLFFFYVTNRFQGVLS